MATKGGPNPVLDSSLILNLDSINLDSYKEITTGNLWNYPASIMSSGLYGWNTWGQSTILNSGNALSVTYVSGNMGAYNYFEADMSISLVAGKTYIVSFDAKTVGGSNTAYGWLNDNYGLGTTSFTNIMTRYSIRFTCNAISWATYLAVWGLSAGNVVTMTNFSLVEVGTTWTDLSGNGNNGTMINGPTYDYSDSSIAFDGTNDAVEVVSTSALEPTVLTVEMYVKRISSYGNILAMTSAGAGAGQPYRMVMNANYPEFSIYGNSGNIGVVSTTSMTSGVWYHLIGTYDRNYMRLYINGVLNNSYAITEPINYTWSSFISLGRKNSDYSGAYFAGNIMGVKIYNRVLSATEVLQNYNALKSRKKFNATGGIITIVDGYKIHTFNSSGTFTTNMSGDVEVLVVAGGGGGGTNIGGGGGGGGVIHQSKFGLAVGGTVVTVGAGGAGAPAGVSAGHPTIPGNNGGNSIFSGLIAIGGGRGGVSYNTMGYGIHTGAAGGSGGGTTGYNNDGAAKGRDGSGSGVPGQGYRGGLQGDSYYPGGGGGAGAPGNDGNNRPDGGIGKRYPTISSYYFGGGGGGGAHSGDGGYGGIGGGGGGAAWNSVFGVAGTGGINTGGNGGIGPYSPGGNGGINTGGGGGGGTHYNYGNKGGDGGSGIVIIKYKI